MAETCRKYSVIVNSHTFAYICYLQCKILWSEFRESYIDSLRIFVKNCCKNNQLEHIHVCVCVCVCEGARERIMKIASIKADLH